MNLKSDDSFFENIESIDLYLRDMDGELLTLEEERELGERILLKDKEAINTMVEKNLRLVISIAKCYRDRGVEFSDLVQNGNIGLIVAAERFDINKEVRFSTFATYWIKHFIRRGLCNDAKNIRMPVYFNIELLKYISTRNKLTTQYGEYPTDKDMARELNVSLKKIEQYKKNLNDTLSLNLFVGDGEDTEILEMIPSESKTPEEEMFAKDLKEKVAEIFENGMLTAREIKILKLRFGFEERTFSLEEIGEIMGVTRERVRQIEKQALRKLRNYKIKNLVGDYLPVTRDNNKLDVKVKKR